MLVFGQKSCQIIAQINGEATTNMGVIELVINCPQLVDFRGFYQLPTVIAEELGKRKRN